MKGSHIFLSCLLALLIVCQAPVSVAAKDLYADINAAAGGDGSAAKPMQTIDSALKKAVAGDTVHVLPGTYYESALNIKQNTALRGTDPATTTISGGDYQIIMYGSTSLSGFTLSGSSNAAVLIKNNVSGVEISNNIFRRNTAYAIQQETPYGSTFFVAGRIANNIFMESGVAAIKLNRGYQTVENNIIYYKNGIGISIPANDQLTTITNNIVHGSTKDWDIAANAKVVLRDNLDLHPAFVSESISSPDYRLAKDSPAIDAGNPDPQENDIDGSLNDMGVCGGPLALFDSCRGNGPVVTDLQILNKNIERDSDGNVTRVTLDIHARGESR